MELGESTGGLVDWTSGILRFGWCERISVSRLCVAGIRRLDVGSRISANRLGAVDFGDWVISAIRFSLVELSDKKCVFVFSPGAPAYT